MAGWYISAERNVRQHHGQRNAAQLEEVHNPYIQLFKKATS